MTEKKNIYCKDYTGDDSLSLFIAFSIEKFKHHRGISGEEAMEILSEAGILEHLVEFYDVLHLHGEKWLMQEIDEMLERKKKQHS